MSAAVVSFGSGPSFGCVQVTKIAPTIENKPACVLPISAFSTEDENRLNHKDQNGVQVVACRRKRLVKFFGSLLVHGIKFGACVMCLQRVEGFFGGWRGLRKCL